MMLRLHHLLSHPNTGLITGSAMLSGGMALARLLGLAFSLVIARTFAPEVYGAIQYSIVLGTLFAIGTQAFGQHVLARQVAISRHVDTELASTLSNAAVLLGGLFVVTIVAMLVLLRDNSLGTGVLAVFVGTSVFYAYWGLARGHESSWRLVAVYVASNAVQILLVIFLIQILHVKSALLALYIYGGSYYLPLLLIQIYAPLKTSFLFAAVQWARLKSILSFAIPVLIAHASYLVFASIDIVFLEWFRDPSSLGVYALTKTWSTLFTFVPTGISVLLMPKIASSPTAEHKQLIRSTLFFSIAVNIVVLTVYLMLTPFLIRRFFGAEYSVDMDVTVILALAMFLFGTQSILTAVLVGRDRPYADVTARLLGLMTTVIFGLSLIPDHGLLGATVTMLIGNVAAVVVYAVLILRH